MVAFCEEGALVQSELVSLHGLCHHFCVKTRLNFDNCG